MKNSKNLLPLFALLLGASLVFTQSAFTSAPVEKNPETVKFWYQVIGGYTSGTYAFHDVKSQVMSLSECEDTPTADICLFGSLEEVPNNTAIGTPSPDNRILKTEE